jgi:hypothetical protein
VGFELSWILDTQGPDTVPPRIGMNTRASFPLPPTGVPIHADWWNDDQRHGFDVTDEFEETAAELFGRVVDEMKVSGMLAC